MSFVSFVWKDGKEREVISFHRFFRGHRASVEDTYDHVDNGMDGSDLGGPGVVCSGEVLSVVLVRGDQRQPGVLTRHKSPNGHHTRTVWTFEMFDSVG